MTPPPRQPGDRARTVLALLPLLCVFGVAAAQAAWPWPFFSDDAFVSLRYSDRLLRGQGLTWTDGQHVEGYSNLLWVLACSALGAIGFDLVAAARLLGALCTAGALWHLWRALRPDAGRDSFEGGPDAVGGARDGADRALLPPTGALLAAAAPLLAATAGTVLAWTLGGLEGPMLLFFLAWGFGATARRLAHDPEPHRWTTKALLACSAPFALACWTRPDSPLWAAGTGIGLGIASLRAGLVGALRPVAWFALLPALAVAAQLSFRLAYYGDWVPNTAHVKAPFDPASTDGVRYVGTALWWLQGLAWPALLGLLVLACARRARPLAWVLGLPAVLWLGYLAWIGGDHFPGHRLLHGALAPMALLAGLGLRRFAVSPARTLGGLGAAAAFAALGLWLSRTDPRSGEVRGEAWEWRGKVVGEALHAAFERVRPRLAVDAAGAVPFYWRLPALDMLGLCDRTIATTPYREWLHDVRERGEIRTLPPGHLRGNGDYVMDEAPDLILLGTPPGVPLPVFVSGLEFETDPRFHDGYRCVLVDLGEREFLPGRTESIVSPLWVRLDGRAGVRASADSVEIPAWLFGAYRLPRPLIMRWLPPAPGTPEAAAVAAGRDEVGRWLRERRAVAAPASRHGATGRLDLELRSGSAAFRWPLAAGSWRVVVEPPGLVASAPGCPPGAEPGTFVVASDGQVELELALPADAPAPRRAARVVLTRVR
jgi:hypothetical protein